MIIILPAIISAIFLIRLTVKKAKVKINKTSHAWIRIIGMLLAIPIIFLIFFGIEGKKAMEGAIYGSFYLFGAWLFYLLAEGISLYVNKQNQLAQTNFLIFLLSLALVGLGTYTFFSSSN